MKKINRRDVIKNIAGGSIALGSLAALSAFDYSSNSNDMKLKGNVNHSVCRWTYEFLPLEKLCEAVKEIGFSAIDLLTPKEWPVAQQYGLYSSMCYTAGKVSLTEGFNHTQFHEQLVKDYLEVIPLMVKEGYKNLICFTVKGVVPRFAGGVVAFPCPFAFGIEHGHVGIRTDGERAFGEVQKLGGCDGVFGDEVGKGESLGVVKLHEREREFDLQSRDAEGCVVEFNVLLKIAVRGVIAAKDFDSAVHDAVENRLAVARGAERGIHFEIGVVAGP